MQIVLLLNCKVQAEYFLLSIATFFNSGFIVLSYVAIEEYVLHGYELPLKSLSCIHVILFRPFQSEFSRKMLSSSEHFSNCKLVDQSKFL